jgi:tetratricopeptide (TPR) repeat protein
MVDRKDELRERYEATGDEDAFLEARRLYEQALADEPTAQLLIDYGYLLYCHGAHANRGAAEQLERAIELDPDTEQAYYQLIAARAALRDPEDAVALCERRLAAAPDDVHWHRVLASA